MQEYQSNFYLHNSCNTPCTGLACLEQATLFAC